ncbi:hypothetical protein BJ912DRAFT_1118435 [Pholiota molesta]|nr:hypothetical protein BJ912DRAFT_1118435 [Pholiota molesta]
MQNIGCTVVVYQPNQPIVSENFFHMPISTALLAKRSGAYSLYLDSLIAAIQAQILYSPTGAAKPLIDALLHNQPLNELVSGSNTVTIATCRIPDFTNIQVPGLAALDFSRFLTHEEIANSHYEIKRKGIVAQVRNWRAMKTALAKLSIVTDDDKKIALEKFGWRATTFKHKSLWYEWALEAARKTWKGGRTPVNQEYRQEYRQWRGIVYLFRPNGAIDRNYIPKGTSADLDERWAADVTQTKMDSMRTTISAHLV